MLPPAARGEASGERLPLRLALAVEASKDAAASWSMASTHAVASVEIRKVTYRDGSTWTRAERPGARFRPTRCC